MAQQKSAVSHAASSTQKFHAPIIANIEYESLQNTTEVM